MTAGSFAELLGRLALYAARGRRAAGRRRHDRAGAPRPLAALAGLAVGRRRLPRPPSPSAPSSSATACSSSTAGSPRAPPSRSSSSSAAPPRGAGEWSPAAAGRAAARRAPGRHRREHLRRVLRRTRRCPQAGRVRDPASRPIFLAWLHDRRARASRRPPRRIGAGWLALPRAWRAPSSWRPMRTIASVDRPRPGRHAVASVRGRPRRTRRRCAPSRADRARATRCCSPPSSPRSTSSPAAPTRSRRSRCCRARCRTRRPSARRSADSTSRVSTSP